ncbi:MAG: amino acid adenylation domain-containing protein, partial [Candidatus Aminicenantes bacterium]
GTPVAGRRHADLEKIIGMFVNTLALRIYPSGEKKFTDFLEEVKEKTLKAFENQDYQYEDLVGDVSLTRNASRNPLFDTMFVLQNTGLQSLDIPALKVVSYEYATGTSKFDLTLRGRELEEKMVFTFEYSTSLFKGRNIERFITYFTNLVKGVLENKHLQLSGIEIIPEAEKNLLLYEFNSTGVEFPRDKTIHQLFEEQVKKTPNRIALNGLSVSVGENVRAMNQSPLHQITYKKLNENANLLAHVLKQKGIQPDTITTIMVERSIEMIVGILGILKAGGAYLPIEPDYPQERIDFILNDSSARVLVDEDLLMKIAQFTPPVQPTQPTQLTQITQPHNLAYVIYTSGSTGKPKGVLVEHFPLVNLLFSQMNLFGISTKDRVLQFSSICFDASVEQIFIALFSGAVLVLVDKNTLLEAVKFETFISTRLITHLHAVPSFLSNMGLTSHYHLKRIVSGGDVCPAALAKKWSKYCDFYNKYGPTETTVTSIEMLVKDVDKTSIGLPIGKPINNTFVYLFDKWMKLVPIGTIGELYIGGEGVARGYLNKPELTAEKFVELEVEKDIYHRSASSHKSHIIYKTGDLARWL